MALSITVNGAGTFSASMEEGPVSFTASLAAVGPAGPAGATGPAGVVAATAPITYNAGTQTVGISATPTFTSVTATTGNLTTVNLTTATFADATSQTTAFVGEARKVYITARNNTGSTIAKGKVVYLSGATGNKPTMALAQADAEATSARTIGILVEETANNADGKVIVSGAAENIDTSSFSDGDTLYLSATTAGAMTTTLPTQPLHGVVIGIVTRANPSVGSVEVSINNYQELEELSDVLISGEANNDLLAWDSTASVWKNRTFSALGLLTSSTAASTYAPIASPTFTGTVTTGGNVTFNDSQAPSVYQFKWDATTGIAGVYAGATAIVTLDNNSGLVLHAPGGSPSSIKFSDNTTQTTKGLIPANNLSDLVSASTARTNLGLGTMAVETASNYLTTASAASTYQPIGSYAVTNAGNTFSASQVISVTDNSNAALRVTQLGTGEAFRVEDSTNPDSTPFVITANGNVGIGTSSPQDKLDVVGSSFFTSSSASLFAAYITTTGNGGGLRVQNSGTGASFRVNDETSDTTPFIVDAGGNVGVKTASPSTDLEVNGNAKFTTAEIVTAPAAGDSSAKVPTTAWVQTEVPAASTTAAGKVELATDAEAITGTSATLVPSLAADLASQLSTKVWNPGVTNLSTGTSGLGANANSTITAMNGRLVAPNASTAGYATRAFTLWSPSNSVNAGLNYGLRSGFSVRMHLTNWTTTLTDVVWRAVFGRMAVGVPVPGSLTARAFGVQFNFATSVLSIIAHDGTTLTTTNLTWSPVNYRTYEITCIHDGAGTVSVYIDGSLIGTGTGAPTTTSTTSRAWWQIEIENTSTSAPANTDIFFANPKVLLLNG